MLTYRFSDDDAVKVRFAISPLGEMGLSLRALRAPHRFGALRQLVDELSADLPSPHRGVLVSLVDDKLRTPDFLNPLPRPSLSRFDDELQDLVQLSTTQFRRDLLAASPGSAHHGPEVGSPDHQRVVVEALTGYWRAGFGAAWPRIRAVLEADVTFRAMTTAKSGLGETLRGLSDQIDYSSAALRLAVRDPRSGTVETRGRGVTLVPTMFTSRVSAPIDTTRPPMLLYPARGPGTLSDRAEAVRGSGIPELIGPVKSELLRVLSKPASTTELAGRLGVTPSAVSQQLAVLARASLVTRSRFGRRVLYRRSELGDRLLDRRET